METNPRNGLNSDVMASLREYAEIANDDAFRHLLMDLVQTRFEVVVRDLDLSPGNEEYLDRLSELKDTIRLLK